MKKRFTGYVEDDWKLYFNKKYGRIRTPIITTKKVHDSDKKAWITIEERV